MASGFVASPADQLAAPVRMDKRERREGRQMQNRCQLHYNDNVCAATRAPLVASRSWRRSSSSGTRTGVASGADLKNQLRIRMLNFWRSSGEPAAESSGANQSAGATSANESNQQVHQSDGAASSSSSAATRTQSPTPSQHHSINIPSQNHSHSSMLTLTHGTNNGLANHMDASQAAHGGPNLPGGRRLLQSLVLPMVLACVIFLMALWARQISRALTNDAIVMMLVMVCIFVVMSAVAFWLSCDHFFGRASTQAGSLASRVPSPMEDEHLLHQHAMCPHHRQHHLQHHQSTSSSLQQQYHQNCHHADHHLRLGRSQSEKCCHISVIDCQPPDYQSALIHSVPIQQYLMFGQDDEEFNTHHHQTQFAALHVLNIDGDSILSSGNEAEQSGRLESRKGSPEMGARQLYLFPPTYEELAKK